MRIFPHPQPIDLGPRPWGESTLERALFLNNAAVTKALHEHPAREILDRLDSLASCLRLLNKSGSAILAAIDFFHDEAETILRRNRRQDLQRIEHELQENLYVFSASSMTLVDQTRALAKKIAISDYDKRVSVTFANNPRHRFIQELRVDMVHVTLHEPSWQLTTGRKEERVTKFFLRPSQLSRVTEYHSLARQFVTANPEGVDLGETIALYQVEVQTFQSWFREIVEKIAADDIADLLRCRRVIRSVSSRNFWQLIVSQVLIQGKRDPYCYLDRYLTPNELAEVLQLPHRSKAQVDKIIELIDETGACDISLRESIYQAFHILSS